MKVWKDVFTGDAMVSTEFRFKEIYSGAGLEVIGKLLDAPSLNASYDFTPQQSLRQSAGSIDTMVFTEGPAARQGPTPRIDIVERFGLVEVKLNKPTWGEYIKLYLKRIKMKLEEDHVIARITDFKNGATQLAKFLTSVYGDLRIFTGRSGDAAAAYAYCYMKERGDAVRPHFMFFLDGLTTDELFIRKSTENSASLIASGRIAYKEKME